MIKHSFLFIILGITSSISAKGLPGSGGSGNNATSSELQAILTVVFGVIGGLSVLMVTISGLRYITSAGDPQKASQARNGILYSLVGLAVAAGAEAIVAFVVGNL